jgi:hypothetical protein
MVLDRPLSPWPTLVTGETSRCQCEAHLELTACPRFAEKLLKAAKGTKGLVEPSYIYLPGVPGGEEIRKIAGVDFFSVPVELGVSPFLNFMPWTMN